MKKYLLLLITTIGFAQINPTAFNKIKVTGATKNNTATRIVVQDSLTKEYHWKLDNTDILNRNANSGILSGGALSVNGDPTKYDLATGKGYIVNSLTGVVTTVTWATQTALTTPYLATSVATYVLIDSAGNKVLQTTAPTPAQYRTHIYLGKLAHTTFTTILFAVTEPSRMFNVAGQVTDLNKFLGSGNIEGNIINYNGANLNINCTAGSMYRAGANYLNDRNSPSITTESAFTAGTFRNKYRNGTGGWIAVNSSVIDPNYYDNGSGTLVVVPNNKYTVKVFWRFGGTGTIHVDYGQTVYDSQAEALASIGKAITVEDPDNKRDASRRGWLVVKQNTINLSDPTHAVFVQADKFGERGISGVTSTLQTVYEGSITPQITTSTGLGALDIKRGSATDNDNVFRVLNGAGASTISMTGAGSIVASSDSFVNGIKIGKGNNNLSNNTVLGLATGSAISTGNANTFLGYAAGNGNTTGGSNVFIGSETGLMNIGGSSNTFIGGAAGFTNSSGANNSFVGGAAGYANTTGGANTFIGTGAGWYLADGTTGNVNSNSSVFIGNNTKALNASDTNEIIIGQGTTGLGSNTTIIGNNSTVFSAIKGRNLVGTTTDNGVDALQVTGSVGLNTAPTTSAGGYDILTRNTSTGKVEKIASTGFGDMTLTTAQTFTATKTFNVAITNTPAFSITNALAGDSSSYGLNMSNSNDGSCINMNQTGSGKGIVLNNSGNGNGILISNSSNIEGLLINVTGTGNGQKIWNLNTGVGLLIHNSSSGNGLRIDNLTTATSPAFILNNQTGTTAKPFQYTKNSVEKAFINDAGDLSAQSVIANGIVRLKNYTVATLPTGVQGDTAYVTDALAPTYMTTVVGGGAVVTPVFHNGTNWVAH